MPLIAPYLAPPPPVQPQKLWQRLVMTWTGWDGNAWELTDWTGGLFLTQGGTRGLLMPPVERYASQSPAIAGSSWHGSRTAERECFWPLYVYSDAGSAEWLALDDAFWRTLQPDQLGVWSVTVPDGTTRTLVCRFSEAEDGIDQDPAVRGWQLYGITLVAEQPYWLGPLSYRHFEVGEGVPAFPADWVSPPDGSVIFISPSTTLASAQIDNPGDLEAPLVYVLEGPWDAGATVGVGTAVNTYASSIPEGQSIVVDMRAGAHLGAWSMATPADLGGSPGWWQAVNAASTSVLSNLSRVALNVSVAPGRSRVLSVNATGQGRIHAAIEPRYWRAW